MVHSVDSNIVRIEEESKRTRLARFMMCIADGAGQFEASYDKCFDYWPAVNVQVSLSCHYAIDMPDERHSRIVSLQPAC